MIRRMQQRRSSDWAAADDDVLLEGEIGLDLDANDHVRRIKVGDGVTPWAELPTLVPAPFAQATGSVNAITATFDPVPDLQDGDELRVRALGANTSTTPTFNPNGHGAVLICKFGAQPLAEGDIYGAGHDLILRYHDGSPERFELLNPAPPNDRNTLSPSQITGNTDNYAPTGLSTARVLRLSTDASRNLSGITGGASGRRLTLLNIGSQPLVLVHDATSTAANRFYLPGSTNYTVGSNAGVELVYDATSLRWRVVDAAAASGGGTGAMTYIGSATVAGAAATTLSISGLDLDSDTIYFVQMEVANATGSALVLSLFYNSDTTATNYDIQALLATGTGTSPGRANTAGFMACAASSTASINGYITKNPSGTRVSSEWRGRLDHTTTISLRTCAHLWRTTSTNVTGLTLSSSVATSLAIGTVIRVWKIDV